MVYGASVPGLTASYSGFVNGDTAASLATPVTLSTSATSSSPVGTYAIQASGATSANYQITFVNGTLTISQASTTTALVASVNPSVYGQMETFTATVAALAPGSGTPTGTVSFMQGSTTLDTETLGASDSVTFTTSALAVGSATITAVYSGDSNFLTSSASTNLTINQAGTTTSLVASVNPSVYGQSVTFTAAVAALGPGSGAPTGTVSFMEGTTTLDTETLGASDVVSFSTSALAVGSTTITAVYSGDSNFLTSSTSTAQTVNQASTATSLTASATTTTAGKPVTLTATVTAVAPGLARQQDPCSSSAARRPWALPTSMAIPRFSRRPHCRLRSIR